MFSLLKQITESLNINLSFFNRKDSPSVKQKNVDGDNIAGDKHVHYHEEPKLEYATVAYAWDVPETQQENHKIIAYEFDLTLVNKSEEIIKDLWINFSTSGFNLEVEETKQTSLFTGWSAGGLGLNLVAKTDYRYAPQNYLHPFKIRIILKKELIPDHDAWLYFSFGAPNVKKVEKEGRVSGPQLKTFVQSTDHSTGAFLKLLGLSK